MKLQLICFFAVQIAFVVCTHRRYGTSSRDPVSFLLRKVCVEVTGLKEEVAGIKLENSVLNDEVAGLKEENLALKEKVTELETEVTGLEAEMDGLKEENSALNDRVSAVEQPGKSDNSNLQKKVRITNRSFHQAKSPLALFHLKPMKINCCAVDVFLSLHSEKTCKIVMLSE